MTQQTKYPKNILLAVDGSGHAFAATKLLGDLPLSSESLITAISVLIPRHAQFSTSLESLLEQAQKQLAISQARIQTEVIAGYPAEIINQFAAEHQSDLTVVGAKGLRSTLGILLGGVAQQVVEYSCCPVMVVRAPYDGLRRIMLVVDGSEHGLAAAEYLAHFCLPEQYQLHLMHVLPPIYQVDFITQAWPTGMDITPPIPTENFEARLKEQAEADQTRGEELLKSTQHQLEKYGIEATIAMERGDAATQIINYAKEQDIDLIVAGSRGLSQIQSWLLGSVSRKLVHYAGCSVLIVKTPPEQE
ncbi:MAG: universal stress protein [Anaerolineales bacterium]|nr:universal stress protein [Anaerolineales bacterium]